MAIDLNRARGDTPGCAGVKHLNNAGSSLPPQVVLEAQVEWLETEAVTGGYELVADRADVIADTYDEVAALIGARREEIALVENATFGWHQAFWSTPLAAGQVVLTGNVEYATGYISMLQAARRKDIEIVVIPDDEHGQCSVEALADLLSRYGERVGLVAITHVPTNGGLVNPAEQIGTLTRAAGVPYLLDACQSVGQLPLDVDSIGCDMMSATGRKFLRGPRGTGFLYVRREFLHRTEPAFLDLLGAEWTAPGEYTVRSDARRFENWESNLAAVVGLRAAARYARDWGLADIADRVGMLADHLRSELDRLPDVTVHDLGARRCGIVTFSHRRIDASAAAAALRAQGVNVSVSPPSATLLDATRRSLPDVVRASPHYYNTHDELDRLVTVVSRL